MSKKNCQCSCEQDEQEEDDGICSAIGFADAFLRGLNIEDADEIESTRETILLVGEYLAETAGPLCWDGFRAKGFFRRISFMDKREQEGIALCLMGFFGWLRFCGEIRLEKSLQIINDILKVAPKSEVLSDFYEHALKPNDSKSKKTISNSGLN